MVTLKNADNALKTLYLGAVAEQLNTAINPLLARIEQTTSDVWGKEIRKLAHFGINGGIGACSEDGNLPKASANNYAQFVLTLKNLYGTIEISDKAIRASENSVGAFVNLLEAEMEALLKASKFNFGRMLFGDGSGEIATVKSHTGNVINVDDTRNLIEGMLVDIFNPVTGAGLVTGRHIVDVDRVNKKMTLDGNTISVGMLTEGSKVYVQRSYHNELTGLGAIFGDSATLYGLDRSQYKWMKPYKKTSASLSDITIQSAMDYIEEASGSAPDFIVCSAGVKRAYQEYLITNRSNIDVMNLQGGYKAISYNGIPVVSDRFCPNGTMYLLNTRDFHLHQLCDWRWLESDNGKVIRQVSDKAAYTATLVKYADLLCDRPSAQCAISGITES